MDGCNKGGVLVPIREQDLDTSRPSNGSASPAWQMDIQVQIGTVWPDHPIQGPMGDPERLAEGGNRL
jgi:hypothetical protein